MKTVLVLGAGASAGTKWGQPPVVRSFFQRVCDLGYFQNRESDPLWGYVEEQLGLSRNRLLELQQDGLENIEKVYSHIADLQEASMGALMERLIHDVLVECTAEHKEKPCPYHRVLIERLRPSAILSFNYDLICDKVLASLWPEWEKDASLPFDFKFDGKAFVETGNRWSHPWSHHETQNLENEYLRVLVEDLLAKKGMSVPEIDAEKEYPLYLKLHGSLNWYYDMTYREQSRATRRWRSVLSLYLVPLEFAFTTKRVYQTRGARDYLPSTIMTSPPGTTLYHGAAELKLGIVPPVYQKEFLPFDGLNWKKAGKALSEAEHIVFVGYSLPDIDLRADRLFRTAYITRPNRSPLRVDVVDPSCGVVNKIRSVYSESEVCGRGTLEKYIEQL